MEYVGGNVQKRCVLHIANATQHSIAAKSFGVTTFNLKIHYCKYIVCYRSHAIVIFSIFFCFLKIDFQILRAVISYGTLFVIEIVMRMHDINEKYNFMTYSNCLNQVFKKYMLCANSAL